MGFLEENNNNSQYKKPDELMEITDTPKMVRPLVQVPQTLWGHDIPKVEVTGPDGKPKVIRNYAYQACTRTGRSKEGCQCCTTQDPLWHLLDPKVKFNKKGQRVDFPFKPKHLLAVQELATNAVRVIKGGNGTFKAMNGWYDVQPDGRKNLARCEWAVHKTGTGLLTNYHMIRSDETPFVVTDEHRAAAAAAVKVVIDDMAPMPTERFMNHISGDGYASVSTQSLVQNTQPAQPAQPSFQQAPAFSQPVQESAPWDNGPSQRSFAPTALQEAPPVPSAPAPVKTDISPLLAFTNWLNAQPEFQGMGVLQNLVPVLRDKVGDTNYHKCTPEQLNDLQSVLTLHLNTLRGGK